MGPAGRYLEQSTRYIPYDDRPGGRWRYTVPEEVAAHAELARALPSATLDDAFETYARWLGPLQEHLRAQTSRDPADSDVVYRLGDPREGMRRAAGPAPGGDAIERRHLRDRPVLRALLLRMRARALAEVREYADLMLVELRKVIPAFLTPGRPARPGRRVDGIPARDARSRRRDRERRSSRSSPEDRDEVTLTDFDPDGEVKVVAAALYAVASCPTTSSWTSRGR